MVVDIINIVIHSLDELLSGLREECTAAASFKMEELATGVNGKFSEALRRYDAKTNERFTQVECDLQDLKDDLVPRLYRIPTNSINLNKIEKAIKRSNPSSTYYYKCAQLFICKTTINNKT